MTGSIRGLAIIAVLALPLVACRASSTTGLPQTTASPGGVAIALVVHVNAAPAGGSSVGVFDPDVSTAKIGDTVEWELDDPSNPHTVTADDGSFDSGPMTKGQRFTARFTKAGTFQYRCTLHSGMVGRITISG